MQHLVTTRILTGFLIRRVNFRSSDLAISRRKKKSTFIFIGCSYYFTVIILSYSILIVAYLAYIIYYSWLVKSYNCSRDFVLRLNQLKKHINNLEHTISFDEERNRYKISQFSISKIRCSAKQ